MPKLNYSTLSALFVLLFSIAISAQTPSVSLQAFLTGLSSPVYLTNAKDGSNRLYVVEKGGVIKVVQPGSTTPTVFLNISSIISTDSERGLLGLAFHPQYATNRRFFVYYTRAGDGAIQIAEYQTSTNPNVANTNGKIIITIPHPDQSNHNGGTIAFGPDGYLYAGTGDGGSANDPPNNAQTITNQLLGKFIRINIDVPAGSTAPYTIPADNPFVGVTGDDEIYALGVRNPYRWSFDRFSGQLWAGDVGQGAVEEADIITKGGNFGWRVFEGTICTGLGPAACTRTNYIDPIFQYDNANSPRCAITGGYVYRGIRGGFPNGAYIYGDYCTGEILMWQNNQQTLLLDSTRSISSFGEDEDGELYVVGLGGTVDRLIAVGPTAATVSIGGRVTTANGRGIQNIVVSLTDTNGNTRATTTTSFGYYRFADVAAGETYIVTAKGKRFTFSQPSQILNLDDDYYEVNFTANPERKFIRE